MLDDHGLIIVVVPVMMAVVDDEDVCFRGRSVGESETQRDQCGK
jgi:hypothetical protein